MAYYWICFRLGAALDLNAHDIYITAEDMPAAIEKLHNKLCHRFPNYKIQSVLPANIMPAEDLVESWRDRI